MTKRMREIQAEILRKTAEANSHLDNKDLDKAGAVLDEIDALQKEFDIAERAEKLNKSQVPEEPVAPQKVDGFKMLAKMAGRQALTEDEKTALISGTSAENGENYLIPEDVKTAINELRKTYLSAKDLVTVVTTDSLTGSVNYEAGAPAGLVNFDDGANITEETGVSFVSKSFTIAHYGKLIPVSRILLGAERASLMNYLDGWFVKNAILSENTKIFATLKAGYASGTPKAIAGWKALKKSINKDLDPACLIDGVIITNQSGFAALDEEEDKDGDPVLQKNPANPTEKLFQGLRIHVFPDAQLPNIDGTHFPMIYGSVRAGLTFVEHAGLEFAVSEHAEFRKNQNLLRVIEGFDAMSTDTSAYIYGSFSATPATPSN